MCYGKFRNIHADFMKFIIIIIVGPQLASLGGYISDVAGIQGVTERNKNDTFQTDDENC